MFYRSKNKIITIFHCVGFEKAVEAYELFYNTEGFDPKQYFLQQTL